MRHYRSLSLALGLAVLAGAALANTYTVTSTADSGAGTLRQAILDANANPGADTIAFNITGSGVHTIAPASALPAITGSVTIDGYTQPGSSANTHGTDQGLDTVLQIEIDCTSTGSTCVNVKTDDVTIRGLVINRASNAPIDADDIGVPHQNLVVEGCFLGTNADGTQALAGSVGGIRIDAFQNVRIGGTTPAARNLISCFHPGDQIILANATGAVVQGNLVGTDVTGLVNLGETGGSAYIAMGTGNVIGGTTADARNVLLGIVIIGTNGGTLASGNFVQGNFIGTDVTGTIAIQRTGPSMRIVDKNNTIGGAASGAGNRIGGATSSAGIQVQGSGTIIQGNSIGTDETGTVRIPNKDYGIRVIGTSFLAVTDVTIGGVNPGEGNVIGYNGGSAAIGVESSSGGAVTGVRIRGNSIFGNPGTNSTNGLGIDLTNGNLGLDYNDDGDGDAGPNNYQNYPILTSVTYGASTTTVAGTLNSAAATTFDVDFYTDPLCSARPQDLPEGKTWLGSTPVTTDGSGDGSFNVVFPVALAAGSPVTATATDPDGNTSEFSPRFVISASPQSGPAFGQTVTVKGLAFEAGATATVGGVASPNVNVTDAHTLTLLTPSLPAGSINDIVVSNPGGGLSGTLPNGWIADFLDVASGNQFYSQVTKLVADGITAGVGGGLYGVSQSTKRQQMAVFLLKAKYGVCYVPPACTGVFPDVPCSSNFAPWIEELATEGITGGCGGGNFCPQNPVLRQQMAVFLLKAEHGSDYVPPNCTGVFGDVACPSTFANWIEQLAAENITGGCGGGNFCPTTAVTRGQMAAFMVKAFNLP